MPGEPGLPQVSQAPLQALEQHAPATQAPELHSALAPQLVPLALSGAQSPAVHPVLALQVEHLALERPQVRLVSPLWHRFSESQHPVQLVLEQGGGPASTVPESGLIMPPPPPPPPVPVPPPVLPASPPSGERVTRQCPASSH